MITDEKIVNRLYNWKFESAADFASPVQDLLDYHDYQLMLALATVYGNVGWFHGKMGLIIQAAVETLIGEEKYGREFYHVREEVE